MLDRQNRGAGKVQCDPKRKSASYADRGGLGRGDGPLFSRLLTVARLSSPLGWTLAALAGAKKRDSFALFIQLASEIHAGFVSRPRYAVRAGAGVFPPPPPLLFSEDRWRGREVRIFIRASGIPWELKWNAFN